MADYTKYRFVELGKRTIVKIDNAIAQIGIWYNKSQSVKFEKTNSEQYGEPFDKIKYQVTNEELISNIGSIELNFPPNKAIYPESQNVEFTMENNQSINLENHIPYNSAVDRVKILSFTNNVGELTHNGSLVYPNKVIMQYELNTLLYSTTTGNGNPYQKIYYQVGNADGYNSTIYTININVNGKASLISLIEYQSEVNEGGIGYKYYEAELKIENGYVNGIAGVKVNIDLSSNAWPENTLNQIIINYTNGNLETSSNGEHTLQIPLGTTGETTISFLLGISLANLPVTGTIKFTLENINEDPSLVSSNNQKIININF